MNSTGLIAGLGEALLPLAFETVTFLTEGTETVDGYGHGSAAWAPVAGLTDLPACVGTAATRVGAVSHGALVVSESDQMKVLLPSYHPEILPETYRMRWNGLDWRITENYPVAVHAITELLCERVLPSQESPDAVAPVVP